jgi:hypothetical protein
MDRQKVFRDVEALYDKQACVSRAEILACIEQARDIPEEEKRVLHSLWERDCYTREEFRGALEAYGWTSPISYGSNEGGF